MRGLLGSPPNGGVPAGNAALRTGDQVHPGACGARRGAARPTHGLWLALMVVALAVAAASAAGAGEGGPSPKNGAPFLRPQEVMPVPSIEADGADPSMTAFRLRRNLINKKGAEACSMGDQAGKQACLMNPDRECMWTHVMGAGNPSGIEDEYSYCLPCEIDGQKIPCWNINAMVGGLKVLECEMSCPHQQRLIVPEYGCIDSTGFISQSRCFDKAKASKSKCMFIAYKDGKGKRKSTCGPCYVSGTGGWGCPQVGGPGPEPDSKVYHCLSQCDVLCHGPPHCPPTAAPPPLPPPPSPGIVETAADPSEIMLAPRPIPVLPPNPYAIAQAAANAAKAAGWKIGKPPAPRSYFPVIMYRSPSDYIFTPGPGPSKLAYPIPGLVQKDVEMQKAIEAGLVQSGMQVEAGVATPGPPAYAAPLPGFVSGGMSALGMQQERNVAQQWDDHSDNAYYTEEVGAAEEGDETVFDAPPPHPLPQAVLDLVNQAPPSSPDEAQVPAADAAAQDAGMAALSQAQVSDADAAAQSQPQVFWQPQAPDADVAGPQPPPPQPSLAGYGGLPNEALIQVNPALQPMAPGRIPMVEQPRQRWGRQSL